MKVLIQTDKNPNESKIDIPFTFYCPVCTSLLQTQVGDYFEDDEGNFYVVCPVCGVKLYKAT